MKAIIKRPDGTEIAVEDASAAEIEQLAGVKPGPAPHICAPCSLPHFPQFIPVPYAPVPAAYPFTWPSSPLLPYIGGSQGWLGGNAGGVEAGQLFLLATNAGDQIGTLTPANAAVTHCARA